MLKRFTIYALILVAATAGAATLTATWTNAVKNTDDSDIPATGSGSLVSTTVEWGPCNAAKDALTSVAGSVTVVAAIRSATSPDLPPGEWCVRSKHRNTYGVDSDPSNVVVKSIAPPKPRPPSNFSLG